MGSNTPISGRQPPPRDLREREPKNTECNENIGCKKQWGLTPIRAVVVQGAIWLIRGRESCMVPAACLWQSVEMLLRVRVSLRDVSLSRGIAS